MAVPGIDQEPLLLIPHFNLFGHIWYYCTETTSETGVFMKYVYAFLTLVAQFIGGYLVLFLGAMFALPLLINSLGLVGPDNSNPWWNTPSQFISFILAASFGVWSMGWLAAKMRGIDFNSRKVWWGTVIGSTIGIIIATIMYTIQGAVGFMPLVLALIGALAGYYLRSFLLNRVDR